MRESRRMKTKKDSRKRVLIVAPHPPFPLFESTNIRIWKLAGLLKEKYAFSLATFVSEATFNDRVALSAMKLRLAMLFEKTYLVPASSENLWTDFLDKKVSEGPAFERMGGVLQKALREERYDLVEIEHIQMAGCRRFVFGPPTILVEHDVGWVWFNNSLHAGRRGWPVHERVRAWLKGLWSHYWTAEAFQGVVLTSPEDMRWWDTWGPSTVPTGYVPLGVDLSRFSFRKVEPEMRRPELLFVGYFHHPPNADAARYFLDEIWPLILDELPDARITFVGAGVPAWLKERAGKNVRVEGYVEDIVGAFKAAHVFVVPTRLGWGIKGKIVEAFAVGLPVAATPSAMSGFPPETRGFVRLGRDAGEFAKETINLLKNKTLRQSMVLPARQWVEKNLSWEKCAERLDAFYRRVSAPDRSYGNSGILWR
ncbi:MAG TPA: glycosyltransferase family 4 protein [Elusimicrobiota bacterium]|nr:glycosyltransferase family 4 protein [Elusimicrobiota bacterium]